MSTWAIASLSIVAICILIDVFFSIGCGVGGFFDLKALLRDLMTSEVDEMDDGRVVVDETTHTPLITEIDGNGK